MPHIMLNQEWCWLGKRSITVIYTLFGSKVLYYMKRSHLACCFLLFSFYNCIFVLTFLPPSYQLPWLNVAYWNLVIGHLRMLLCLKLDVHFASHGVLMFTIVTERHTVVNYLYTMIFALVHELHVKSCCYLNIQGNALKDVQWSCTAAVNTKI